MMYKYLVTALLLQRCSCYFYCGLANKFIDVSSTYKINTTSCIDMPSKYVICSSLKAAFETQMLNDSCIRIHDKQAINGKMELFNISNVYISANSSNKVAISCSKNTGFQFAFSSHIFISNLAFFNCGLNNTSTGFVDGKVVPIWTAFYLKNIEGMYMCNCDIVSSYGYGLVMYDITGKNTLKKVNIYYNRLVPFEVPGFYSGGGLYMEYTSNAIKKYATNVHFTIHKCNIYSNKADSVSAHPKAEGLLEGHIPFARGAGIVMYFRGKAQNNEILINDSYIGDNTAAWGGGLYVRYREEASNNTLRLVKVLFSFNRASYSGGAACVVSTQKAKPFQNTVSFYQCHFTRNYATIGAGVSLLRAALPHLEKEKAIFTDCVFKKNVGSLGSALQIEHARVVFTNVNITDSNIETVFSQYDGRGAVYVFESLLAFYGTNYICNNEGTAFILDCSDVLFEHEALFMKNSGGNGGALALYGHSKMYLKNTTKLVFKENVALRKGGAIYVEIPGPSQLPESIGVPIYECFFQFQGKTKLTTPHTFGGKVIFDKNVAESGASVFATTLKNCLTLQGKTSGGAVIGWQNFHVPNNTVMTRAVRIQAYPGDWKVSPGKFFSPTILLYDELNNQVSETIDVILSNSDQVSIETNSRFVVRNNKIHLRLLGPRLVKFDVQLVVADYRSTSYMMSNLTLKHCYFGYTFVTNRCVCDLLRNQARGISGCADNGIYLKKGRWADPNQPEVKYDKESTKFCPLNYCITSCKDHLTDLDCLFVPKSTNQCVSGRDPSSRLCGSCLHNYSVSFGGETCVRCTGWQKYNFIWVIPLFLVITALIILLILWLNVDIYSNYLNGFLYYFQIVGLLKPSNLQFDGPLGFFIGVLTMDGSGGQFKSFCMWDGLNNLQKTTLNFIFPVGMILFLMLVAFYAKYRPDSYFRRQNCLCAFTIVSVIAYCDFTRVTLKILDTVDIGNHTWVEVNAKMRYMGSEHLGYAIFACIALIVIVIGLPVLLILQPWLISIHCRCFVNPLITWKPIFDSFTYCFRYNCAWFSSYYFLSRAGLLILSTLTDRGPEENVHASLVCFLVCVVFCIVLPYKNMWMNAFDAMVLGNLTAVAVLSLGMRSVYSIEDKHTCATLIKVLVYIPLLVVLARLMYIYAPKFYNWTKEKYSRRKCNKMKRLPVPQRSLLQNENVTTDDEEEYG